MKKTLRPLTDILQILIKCILIVVVFFASYTYLNKVFYNRTVDRGISFHSLPEDTIDVIVLGSSHAQYSFVPGFFYEDTGLYSYVLGSACQPLEVSVEMLKEALKTQSPKLVILEGYTCMPLHITSCLTDGCYVTAEYQMRGNEKYDTIAYLPEEKADAYYNDFFSYHNDWKTTEDWSIILPQKALTETYGISEDFGYVFMSPPHPISNFWGPLQSDAPAGKLDERDEQSLNELLKICKENGIELYLYKTSIDSVSDEDWAAIRALWKWADDNGVQYFDLLSRADELQYLMQVHTDGFHSYVHGAAFITDMLADLTSELGITYDHKKNDMLEEMYKTMGQSYTADVVQEEEDPIKVLHRLKGSTGYVFLRYIPSIYKPSDKLEDALYEAGFNTFDKDLFYFAIFHDGELIYEGQEGTTTELGGKTIVLDNGGITIGDNRLESDGLMSLAYMSENGVRNAFLDIEYREATWKSGGYNYEDLFWR